MEDTHKGDANFIGNLISQIGKEQPGFIVWQLIENGCKDCAREFAARLDDKNGILYEALHSAMHFRAHLNAIGNLSKMFADDDEEEEEEEEEEDINPPEPELD